MQVKHIEGIQFQGKILDGSLAAKALCTSFADPWDIEAYHELKYLMNSLEARYDLDGRSFDLLYDAYAAGQIAYDDTGGFSNFAAWYVDADHGMVPDDGLPYTFAGNDEISAARSATWRDDPASEASQRIQAAKDAGASAICQTYFFIGNLENQYSGADVPLYDFIVMVETSLDTSDEALLFTAPADSIPARKASITERLDGTTTMMLAEDAAEASPLQVVFEVGPRDDVAALARRVQAGEQLGGVRLDGAVRRIRVLHARCAQQAQRMVQLAVLQAETPAQRASGLAAQDKNSRPCRPRQGRMRLLGARNRERLNPGHREKPPCHSGGIFL